MADIWRTAAGVGSPTRNGTARRGAPAWRRRVGAGALAVAAVVAVLPLRPATAASRDGVEVLCSRSDFGCLAGTGYHGQSVWGANYGVTGHNCTSYVSYLLAKEGVAEPWHVMGNANSWDDNAKGRARVDAVPAAGAVAQWEGHSRYASGPSGHVAFVDAVTPSGIDLSEDNHAGGTRRLHIDPGSPYWPSHFIHIHDLAPVPQLTAALFTLAGTVQDPAPTAVVHFGTPGDIPVRGDWDGSGRDTLGLFRDGTWTLSNGRTGAQGRTTQVHFGEAGDTPVVGDWNGDGKDDLGLFRDGAWTLATPTEHDPAHVTHVQLGAAGDTPVVGDWDGMDGDTIGVFRDGAWTLVNDLYGGLARRIQLRFGAAGDRPVVGNWDGVRGDGVGVEKAGVWSLSNALTGSLTDVIHLHLGDAAASPIAGSWDGRGGDTVGITR